MGQHLTRTRILAWPIVLLTLAMLHAVVDGPLTGCASADDLSPRLKTMLGLPPVLDKAEIETVFAEDMKAYAAALPRENQNYRAVLKHQVAGIAELDDHVEMFKKDVELLKERLKAIPAGNDTQMAALRSAADKARMELAQQRQQTQQALQECARPETEGAKCQAELRVCQKEMAAMAQRHAEQIAKLQEALKGQGAVPKPADEPDAGLRVWTDASGQHRVEAILIKLEDGKVVLRRRDGRVVALPLEKLSRQDQDYVRRCGDSP